MNLRIVKKEMETQTARVNARILTTVNVDVQQVVQPQEQSK